MEDTVSLLLVVLLLVLILDIVTFVARVQPVRVLVVAAARNCTRAGVETLAADRGMHQALFTAREMARSGTAIAPDGLGVTVYIDDQWGRGRVLVCEVTYRVRVDDVSLLGWFYEKDHVECKARASLSIEPYKSRWQETRIDRGWGD